MFALCLAGVAKILEVDNSNMITDVSEDEENSLGGN
jgi:hypothetical protein